MLQWSGTTVATPLKILFVSHFVPFPPAGGCFQRNFNLLRRLGARLELHLIALRHKRDTHPEAETTAARLQIEEACRTLDIVDVSRHTHGPGLIRRAAEGLMTGKPFNAIVYRSAAVAERIRTRLAETPVDVVHFDTIGLAQYLPLATSLPTLVTHHGAESFMIRRRMAKEPNLALKTFLAFEGRALERYERRMCPRFDVNVTMSEDDTSILRSIAPDAAFAVVPNGVDLDYFSPAAARGGRHIVFAGRMDQYSNRDGMLHFLGTAWPLLLARYPDATIDIIGSNPPDALRRMAAVDSRIRVHGFVPDVRPYFDGATVALCPVRNGGGTRLKVLDALAQGMPLVSTSVGCEGLDVTPGRDVLVADTPEAFVHQIGRAFDDEPLRSRLARNGRQLIESRYSWDALAERLIEQYRLVAGHAAIRRTA